MSSIFSIADRFRSWAPIRAISTRIHAKLLLTLFGASALPLIVLGVVMYRSAADGISDQANGRLESIRSIKANQVESYFRTVHNQIETFSENTMIVEAMRQFPDALRAARDEAHIDDANLEQLSTTLGEYYTNEYAREYKRQTGVEPPVEAQFDGVDADTRFLQHKYIALNPNPLGNMGDLDAAEDETTYSKLHGKYHPIVRNYLQKFEYNDIFLCDLQSGDIVYSVNKALDFTTSLIDGPYADSNFGRVFRQAAAAENRGDVYLVDYEPYLPSYENTASFIASPIFDGDEKIGVAIFRIPITRINQIMAERTGLGETGEIYAVGPDKLFRSESRFIDQLNIDTAIINQDVVVDTLAANSALAGNSGTGIIDGYRGGTVLSSWTPITIYPGIEGVSDPIRWGLLSEIDDAEVTAPITATSLARKAGWIVVLGLFLGLSYAMFFAQGITRQAKSINAMLTRIGIGDFDARAQVVTQDELGDVAIALNAMCDNTLSLIQSREERDRIEESILELVRELQDIADGDLTIAVDIRDDMTGPITGSVNFMLGQLRGLVKRVKMATDEVNESAMDVQEISTTLSKDSARQSNRITTTSNQIREITESIQSVATKTRESAEVAAKARQSATEGLRAVSDTINGMQRIRNQVQETSKRIKRLGESSQEIGEIVQLISDIADRTSILALNASIQAAMAGESGQGFSVVAEEVERLADRSNDATRQIATLIKAIQAETRDAVIDMEESTREVVEGSQLAAQAGATLSEIDCVSAQLVELIADVSSETQTQTGAARKIAATMGEIAETTYVNAGQSRTAAQQVGKLAESATDLRNSVSQFRVDIAEPSEAPRSTGVNLDFTPVLPTEWVQDAQEEPFAEQDETQIAKGEDMADAVAMSADSDLPTDHNALMDPAQYPLIKGTHGFPTRVSKRSSV